MSSKKVCFGDTEVWDKFSVSFHDVSEYGNPPDPEFNDFILKFLLPNIFKLKNAWWTYQFNNYVNNMVNYDYFSIKKRLLEILDKLRQRKSYVVNYRRFIIVDFIYYIPLSISYMRLYIDPKYCATRINRVAWKHIIYKRTKEREINELRKFLIKITSANKIKMTRQISTGIYDKF